VRYEDIALEYHEGLHHFIRYRVLANQISDRA
jgi:hypothetical protein